MFLYIPSSFLRAVNRALVSFLWAQKPRWLAQSILRLPKLLGGMALPDVRLNHMTCQLKHIIDWCFHSPLKQWVHIERLLAGIPLDLLPWCQTNLSCWILDHPTVGVTWRTAQIAFCDFSNMPTSSPLTPVVGNLAFSLRHSNPRFQDLKRVERSQVHHFLFNGQWMTRQWIMEDTALAGLSFWQKIQLAHFIGSLAPEPFRRKLTSFKMLCLEQFPMHHVVSLTYQLLLSPPPGFWPPYISKREQDLGLQFEERQVERLLLFSSKTLICANQQEAGYKVLTRWYYTSLRCSLRAQTCAGGMGRNWVLSSTSSGLVTFAALLDRGPAHYPEVH